jgi:hypothetical protein
MSLVSVTRFRLRSIRFVPFFVLHANRTIAQIRKADGFVAGTVQRDAYLAFWTVTVWRDEHAMRASGASGAHRKAMPHLADWPTRRAWGTGGSPAATCPSGWKRFVACARKGAPLTLRHPVPNHPEQRFAEPQMTYGMRL